MFHFFFDTSQNETQSIKVNLNRDTDSNLRETSSRMVTFSVTDSEDHDENSAMNDCIDNDEIHFVSLKSILFSVMHTNTYSISSTHIKAEEHQDLVDEQCDKETVILLNQISQLLFDKQIDKDHWNFIVLFSMENEIFHRHHVNHYDKQIMIVTL